MNKSGGTLTGMLGFFKGMNAVYLDRKQGTSASGNATLYLPYDNGATLATESWVASNYGFLSGGDGGKLICIDVLPTADHNTCILRMVYNGYRAFTGILFTRYGVHGIGAWFGTSISTATYFATKICGNDSVTCTISSPDMDRADFKFKSSHGWNTFTVIGRFHHANDYNLFKTNDILTIYSSST